MTKMSSNLESVCIHCQGGLGQQVQVAACDYFGEQQAGYFVCLPCRLTPGCAGLKPIFVIGEVDPIKALLERSVEGACGGPHGVAQSGLEAQAKAQASQQGGNKAGPDSQSQLSQAAVAGGVNFGAEQACLVKGGNR